MSVPIKFRALGPVDVTLMRSVLKMFGKAFNEVQTYSDQQPSTRYLRDLLSRDSFIAVAAMEGKQTVGGVAAYVLPKFE